MQSCGDQWRIISCGMLYCFAFEEKWIDWAYEGLGQESSEFEDEFSQIRWEWCEPVLSVFC
jgi:hypothetical protein